MCCNCGTVAVFCTSTPAPVVDTTGMSTTWSNKKRAATVGSRLSPTLSAHRRPAQQTSITLSMYCMWRNSFFLNRGTIGICICATTGCRRHADETAHLALHSNGHVNLVQELHLWRSPRASAVEYNNGHVRNRSVTLQDSPRTLTLNIESAKRHANVTQLVSIISPTTAQSNTVLLLLLLLLLLNGYIILKE